MIACYWPVTVLATHEVGDKNLLSAFSLTARFHSKFEKALASALEKFQAGNIVDEERLNREFQTLTIGGEAVIGGMH